jgi:hypothetical protein
VSAGGVSILTSLAAAKNPAMSDKTLNDLKSVLTVGKKLAYQTNPQLRIN